MKTETLVMLGVAAAAAFLVWRRIQDTPRAPTSTELLTQMARQAEPPLLETLPQPSWVDRGMEAGYF